MRGVVNRLNDHCHKAVNTTPYRNFLKKVVYMKILGGKLKGRNFFMPAEIRPTQNIIRKAVIDILGQDLEGMDVLELFAGSGAIGIEAISRDANSVVMVERGIKCAEVIRENLDLLGVTKDSELSRKIDLLNSDAFASIKMFEAKKRKFDVIFIDPPYSQGLAKKSLKTLSSYAIFNPNCAIIIEHCKDEILPEKEGRIILFKQKKYGKSLLSVYEVDS